MKILKERLIEKQVPYKNRLPIIEPSNPIVDSNGHSVYIKLSAQAYKNPRLDNVAGYEYRPDLSDEYFASYVNYDNREAVLSCRGTNVNNVRDLINDLVITFKGGANFPRLIIARAKLNDLIRSNPGLKYIVTGHSLGGAVARILADENRTVKAITFNAAAPPTSVAAIVGNTVTSYHIAMDIISAWLGVGGEIVHRIDQGFELDSHLKSLYPPHALDNFFNYGNGYEISSEKEDEKWQNWYNEKSSPTIRSIFQTLQEKPTTFKDIAIDLIENAVIRKPFPHIPGVV